MVAVGLNLPPIIRAPLAIPLVLYLPGYTLALALLPPAALSRVEFLVVSVTLSIAVSALGGLLLGLTPNGLNPLSVDAHAERRRHCRRARRLAPIRRRCFDGRPPAGWPRPGRVEVAVLVVATLAVAAILTGTTVIASRMVAPPTGAAVDAARRRPAKRGAAGHARGHARRSVRDQAHVERHADRRIPVTLGDGEQWQTTVTFDPADRTKPIVARLYEGDSATDIRFVILAPAASGGG